MTFGRLIIAAWISAAAMLAVSVPAALAQDMTFRWATTGEACADCRWIAARGELMDDSADTLAKFLKGQEVAPGTLIRLDSEGGALEGSMTLGRMIRARGLSTAVGGTQFRPAYAKDRETAIKTDTLCASACSYTFLGGVERSVEQGSRLGVHQFYSGGRRARGSDAGAQAAIASLARYMTEMGVSSDLIVAAADTPPDRMNWLNRADLEAFHAVTDVTAPVEAEWTFAQAQDALYLVSRQLQKNGSITEYRVACSASAPQLIQLSARRETPLLTPDKYEAASKAVRAVHFNRAAGDIQLAKVETDAQGMRIAGEIDRGDFEQLVQAGESELYVDLDVASEYVGYLGGASHRFPVKNIREAMPVLLRNCSAAT